MQVSVETTSNLGRKLTVQIPADHIDPEIEKRLKSMSSRVRLDGFRPGKVPMRVVKQRYGSQVVQEVMGEFMQSSFRDAVTQENLRPAGGPMIDPKTMGAGEGLEYTATFEVYPEFKLADFDGIQIKRPVVELADADVDEMLEALRKQRRIWEPVERAAALGDQLVVDFVGSIGGEPFEDNEGSDVVVELGSGGRVPGFEEQLVGATPGEERTINVTYPPDYQQEKFAGRDVRFDVTVKSVAQGRLPDLDDDFVAAFGVSEGGVEALKKEARANMEREMETKIEERVKSQIMDALREANDIELPAALIDQEIERAREQMSGQFGQAIEKDKFPDELFAEQAKRRVAVGLVIGEVIKQYELAPDKGKVDKRLEAMASSYEEPQQLINYYRGNPEAMSGIEGLVLEEQVMDCVLARASVSEETMSFSELTNPQGDPK